MTARVTWAASACALIASGCFLPPRAEDRPLTAEVETGPEVDSSIGGARTTGPVDGPSAAGAAGARDASAGQGAGTPQAAGPANLTAGAEDKTDSTSDVVPAAASGASGDAAEVDRPGDVAVTSEVTPGATVKAPADVRPAGASPAPQAAEQAPDQSGNSDVEKVASAGAAETGVSGESALEDAGEPAPGSDSADSESTEPVTPAATTTDLVPAAVEETIAETDVDAAPEAGPAEQERAGLGALRTARVGTSDGLEMTYSVREPLEEPDAPLKTVVLVHGWCGVGGQWEGVAEALPAARVLVVDLIGHGSSADQPRAEWTVPRFGADVARMLGAEDLRDVVLVGHGMGGQVCLEAAARAPERVGAIVGVDCLQRLAGDPNPGRLQQFVETFRRDYEVQMRQFVGAAVGAETAPALTERIASDALAAPREMALALMEHFGVHDPRRAAPRIECPVVCINSGSLATDVQGNRALLSSFDVEVLEGPGHWLHLEAPERFAQTLRSVLQGLEPEEEADRLLHSLSPILVVEDPEAVATFYTERLSFRLARRSPQDLAQPAAMIALERDGSRVVLQSLESLRAEFPGAELGPRSGVLFLRVDSIAAELAAVGENVPVVSPERVLPSGARQVTISDPEGNLVVLQQSADTSSGVGG